MPAGLRILNANGSVQFDTTNRMYRVLTVQLANGNNGSYSSSELSKGTPLIGVTNSRTDRKPPTVSVSGNTVSWSYGSTSTSQRDANSTISIAVY